MCDRDVYRWVGYNFVLLVVARVGPQSATVPPQRTTNLMKKTYIGLEEIYVSMKFKV